ncbi:uncharacterized protein LOC134831776 [Culicoides brevitarsis]|uniref:uncharacterized protein LOC134831776 n=1 Tax=Culicoides brevitarsis TaxID=469753 RepID=UPI00307B7531
MSKFVSTLFCFYFFHSFGFSLKMTNFHVPSTVIIDKNNPEVNNVNLTCNYHYIRIERGFNLKWYFNQDLIYVWSPKSSPRLFGRFANHIDAENSVNGTLVLHNVTQNLTGTYQCIAMTYEALVKKHSHLQVIIPEDYFLLERIISPRFVEYRCAVNNIFPNPYMKISWNSSVLFSVTRYGLQGENGLYDISESIYTSNHKAMEANVSCELKITNTDYRKVLVFDPEESNTIEMS